MCDLVLIASDGICVRPFTLRASRLRVVRTCRCAGDLATEKASQREGVTHQLVAQKPSALLGGSNFAAVPVTMKLNPSL